MTSKNIKCPCCGSANVELDFDQTAIEKQYWCNECELLWDESKRQPPNAWIACSERLPKYGVKVAAIHNEFYRIIAKVDKDRGWITSSAKLPIIGVTHWYPLPQLPKTESEV